MAKFRNLKFENKFIIPTLALRLNKVHPDSPRNLFWFIQFFFFIGVFSTCSYFLFYSIVVHHLKAREFEEAIRNGSMLIVTINITYMYIVMLTCQKDIKELMKSVEKDFSDDNNYSDEDKDVVQEYADKGVLVCKLWSICGVGANASYPLKAFTYMIYYYCIGEFRLVQMFDIKVPEPLETYKNSNSIAFWAFFLLTYVFDFLASTLYIGFDSLVPVFMLHVCGQLILLSQRLGRIFVQFDDPKEIEQELKFIIMKLQSLYSFMDRIIRNFPIIYECNMKTTTFLLPLVGILIFQDLSNFYKNPEFVILFGGSIIHFFIPCYFSGLLMDQCENLRQAIYSSGWETCTHKGVRQIILFMLIRARTPMAIRTIFYEINLYTFAEMCRQAYTLFNVMNAASIF